MSAPWSFAVPDWRERIRAGKSLLPALPIDEDEYKRVTRIFDKLRLPDVVGKPALSEAGGEWFREITGTVLASIDKAGHRQVPELFLMAPKKSSKTSYGAAFMDTALLVNERPRAEFLMVAPTIAIAQLAFNQAVGMIEADETGFLPKRMQVTPHLRRITDRRTKATLEIKAFDTSILTGIKPAGVLLDELHEIAKNAAAQRIIGQIRGGMIAIPESFLAMITTQSDQPPRGAFKAELDNARDIRDGKANGRTLSVLYEFPEDIAKDEARWKDKSVWWMVTPNLDRSVTLPKLQEGLERAERDGLGEVIRWASQHLNIEIGIGLRGDRWAGAEHWEKRADPVLAAIYADSPFDALDALLDRSEAVVVGHDGGGLDDLAGLTVLGREPAEFEVEFEFQGQKITQRMKRWLSWSHAWCHQGVLERRKSIASKLQDLERAGELTIVGDVLSDVGSILEIIKGVKARGLLAGVALDPAGISEFADALIDDLDITQENGLLLPIKQSFNLMNAIKTAERRLATGLLLHCGGELMRWCVGNVKIEPMATAIRATKQNAGDAKIDPVMALFDAVTFMATNPQVAGRFPADYRVPVWG